MEGGAERKSSDYEMNRSMAANGIPILPGGPGHLLMTPDSLSNKPLPGQRISTSLFLPTGCATPPHRYVGRSSYGGASASPAERPISGTLELEAVAAVHELSFAVAGISVSEMLPRTPELIFVNVTTLEGQAYCLELTGKGWRVTSLRHDCMNGEISHIELHTKYFESPYALMDAVSPGYRQKFSEALSYKLSQLSQAFPVPSSVPLEEEKGKQTSLSPRQLGPVQVSVRHPSGEANQSFPDPPSRSPNSNQ